MTIKPIAMKLFLHLEDEKLTIEEGRKKINGRVNLKEEIIAS